MNTNELREYEEMFGIKDGFFSSGEATTKRFLVIEIHQAFKEKLSLALAKRDEEIEKLLDSDEMIIDDGMNYGTDVDITELPPGLIAEMKGVRKGWEASKTMLRELLANKNSHEHL